MSKLGDFYRRNIYGVMGTLIFHILLVLSFFLADVDIKGNVKEKEIIIEFPQNVSEPEKIDEQKSENQEETPNEPSSQQSLTQSQTTNRASNRLSTSKDFFDKDYQKEVEAAQQLSADVNNQLSKKRVKLEDIQMPVESTEGMNPDSIKNVVYTGESNIVYYLENRYHISLPIPVYLAQGGGKVIVDIAVNRSGRVVEASARKNPVIRDEQIYTYAEVAASRTIFNADPEAPEIQRGTIHYNFIAQ